MRRDPRVYITVDVGMPDHPKVEGLSDAAFRLLVTLWCWSSRQLTDGHIKVWSRKGTAETRDELVDAGLVETNDDGSAVLHDFTEHQRTADEVAELREKRAEAGRKGGLAKASKNVASATAVAKQTASKSLAETETDTTSKASGAGSRKKRATALAADWTPTDSHLTYCRDNDLDPGFQLRQFKSNAEAKGLRYVSWNGAFATWLGNAVQYGHTASAVGGRKPTVVPAAETSWTPPLPPADMPDHLYRSWNLACAAARKAGQPMPDDWHGLTDERKAS